MKQNLDAVRKDLLQLIDDWMKKLNGNDELLDSDQKVLIINQKETANILSVKELGQYLGVSTDTIYKMVRENQIPYIRVRRRILFYKDSIEEWLKQR